MEERRSSGNAAAAEREEREEREEEVEDAQPQPPQHGEEPVEQEQLKREHISQLLELARNSLGENHPFEALEHVVEALRHTTGSELGVLRALSAAKEQHRRVVAARERPGPNWELLCPPTDLQEERSLLAEGQRQQVILDAARDGSSYACPQCNGLISMRRREQHQLWCSPTTSSSS
ncbi:hypothetical protein QOT17_024479 [Balamuthia mandrillaris]